MKNKQKGVSFVEVLVTAAVITLFFGGLMASFQGMLSLVGSSKEKSGALALANERLEYIRSLPYDDVGTEGGIPSGNIPQVSTTTINGVSYTERVLVSYVDAPEDGVGGDDDNGILADYKQVKVEYSWNHKGTPKSIFLLSNIVPNGIESTAGGGTLTVNVFDAGVNPVENASVRVYNNNGTSTIDTTRYTNASGVAQFAGADALSGYEITVTKTDYSTDGTYTATAVNTNPITPPVSVVAGEVSTMYFAIDELSDLTVKTVGQPTIGSTTDSFADQTGLSSILNTTVSGGAVVLSGSGSYPSDGEALSTNFSPASFDSWNTVEFNTNLPADTSIVVQVYQAIGSSTALISDTDLPGNSSGFSGGVVDISNLDVTTYTSLALKATLSTTDASSTPELLDWLVSYVEDEPTIGNIPFSMIGAKTIGTNASSSSIYKYDSTHTTDGSGTVSIPDLEWDTYNITLDTSSYDIAEACEPIPYALSPGVNDTLKLTLANAVTNSLRVLVEDISGNAIVGATVTLSRTGFSADLTSSTCGQAFFNDGLSAASDYQIDVTKGGYTDTTVTDVTVDGSNILTVIMS